MLGLFSDPVTFLLVAVSILAAITVHEFSHAFAADRLGDPTPRSQGRLSLNPIRHLDPIGTLALFLVGFGWGKPVQFDPYNLGNAKRDVALISFAGPASNFIFAILVAILFRVVLFVDFVPVGLVEPILTIAPWIIYFNVILGVFNLLPIHPLDGGKVLVGLLPDGIAEDWDRILNQYGVIILLVLILPIFGSPLVLTILGPTIRLFMSLLLPMGGGFGLF